MTSDLPRASVIVPVYNRRELLRSLLIALSDQTLGSSDFEVIVVDDGSDDGSAALAEGFVDKGLPVRVIRTARGGAVAARCTGVEASRAPFLAFTDSDCVPAPDWLEAGVTALESGADVVNGSTRPAGPVGVLDHSVASGEEGLYPTCNVFYRRSAFDTSGGFDGRAGERLRFRIGGRAQGLGFGEDTLLAWQVRRRGRGVFAPDAVVEHQVVRGSIVEALSRAWMVAAFPALVREVPELRDTILFRRGISLGPRSRLPVYALALGVTVRRPIAVRAAAAWWLWSSAVDGARQPGGRSTRLAAVPVIMARDAVMAAALSVGSVRARTLVL